MQNKKPNLSENICFVSSTLSSGGAERALSNLLCNMSNQDFNITILLLNKVITYPVPENVKIVDLYKRSPFHLPICFMLLIFNLVKLRPSVVVSVWSFPSLLTGLALLVTRIDTKWIPRIANNPKSEEYGWRKVVFNILYKKAIAFIVLCEELQDRFIEHYPFARGKTHIIRNGFDIDDLQAKAYCIDIDNKPPNCDYIVSVGSLTQQKRFDLLLRAYALIDPKFQIPLVIIGRGPLLNGLQCLARELGIADKIVFKGFQKNPYPFVVNSKLFVLASDFEGLCNAAIEAQCLGIPAVITDCPTGNREIVENGVTGMLAKVGDAQVISEKIELILGDEDRLEEMGEAAKKILSEKYRIEISAGKFHALLKGLL